MAQILICDYCKQQVSNVTQITINDAEFDFCETCAGTLMSQLTGNPSPQTAPSNAAPKSVGGSLLCDSPPPKPAKPKRKPGRPKGSIKKEPPTDNPVSNLELPEDERQALANIRKVAMSVNPKDIPEHKAWESDQEGLVWDERLQCFKGSADINKEEVKQKMLARHKAHRDKLNKRLSGGKDFNVKMEG